MSRHVHVIMQHSQTTGRDSGYYTARRGDSNVYGSAKAAQRMADHYNEGKKPVRNKDGQDAELVPPYFVEAKKVLTDADVQEMLADEEDKAAQRVLEHAARLEAQAAALRASV